MKHTLRPLLNGSKFNIYALALDGTCKMEEFLADVEHLDKREWTSLMAFLERCAEHGPPQNKEKSRPLGDDLFEFKSKGTRICYFYDKGQMIVCTHGFHKPQGKVQNAEIKAAKKVLKNYLVERKKGPILIEDAKE